MNLFRKLSFFFCLFFLCSLSYASRADDFSSHFLEENERPSRRIPLRVSYTIIGEEARNLYRPMTTGQFDYTVVVQLNPNCRFIMTLPNGDQLPDSLASTVMIFLQQRSNGQSVESFQDSFPRPCFVDNIVSEGTEVIIGQRHYEVYELHRQEFFQRLSRNLDELLQEAFLRTCGKNPGLMTVARRILSTRANTTTDINLVNVHSLARLIADTCEGVKIIEDSQHAASSSHADIPLSSFCIRIGSNTLEFACEEEENANPQQLKQKTASFLMGLSPFAYQFLRSSSSQQTDYLQKYRARLQESAVMALLLQAEGF